MSAAREPGPGAVVLAVALAWGLVFAAGAYAVVRAVQALAAASLAPAMRDGAGPALAGSSVNWGVHAGFFWRAWTVGYAGGLAAFVVFLVVGGATVRRTEAAARALGPAIAVAAGLLVAQSAFLP